MVSRYAILRAKENKIIMTLSFYLLIIYFFLNISLPFSRLYEPFFKLGSYIKGIEAHVGNSNRAVMVVS